MPELPEVECVRRSLQRLVAGRLIGAVRVIRPDIIRGESTPGALLTGQRITAVRRHGKQLAVVGSEGGCVCVHLGMSGQLCVMQGLGTVKGSSGLPDLPPHTHVLWRVEGGLAVRFTDPRRFGGLWTFGDVDALEAGRWSALGPDALAITPRRLYQGLSATRRPIKAALLDQNLVAGLGNIYVDELLFSARLHPLMPAAAITARQSSGLVTRMRTLLRGAIDRGGSSLRDYIDAESRRGSQQTRHRAYGRSGKRCVRRGCSGRIETDQVAGRTTAWCPGCQRIGA